jgi:hypothetical protein
MNMTGFLAMTVGLSIQNDWVIAALTSDASNIDALRALLRSTLPGRAGLLVLELFIIVTAFFY